MLLCHGVQGMTADELAIGGAIHVVPGVECTMYRAVLVAATVVRFALLPWSIPERRETGQGGKAGRQGRRGGRQGRKTMGELQLSAVRLEDSKAWRCATGEETMALSASCWSWVASCHAMRVGAARGSSTRQGDGKTGVRTVGASSNPNRREHQTSVTSSVRSSNPWWWRHTFDPPKTNIPL